MRIWLIALLFATAPAAAQNASDKEPRKPLNLQLDNPGAWATVAPSTAPKDPKAALPSLGDDARTMPTQVPRTPTKSPFPEDSNPGR